MKTLIFTVAVLLTVPALRAQQDEVKEAPVQAVPQSAAENSNEPNTLPQAIRPGHPLDPADVDILTGKRDREIDASRRAALPVSSYGAYEGAYGLNGRQGGVREFPLLPLRKIENPLFFFSIQPRGFGRGFGSGRRR